MKKNILLLSFFICSLALQGLIVRHDVPQEKFIELAKQYPQICHLPMGEGTLIDSCWILTAGHIGNDLLRDMANGYSAAIRSGGIMYAIEKVFLHPEFKTIEVGLQNDIALIKIKGGVKNIIPAKIYDNNDESGKKIVLVGMGDMGNGLTGPQNWDKRTRAATNKIDGVEKHWIYFSFDSPDSPDVTPMEGISGPGDSGGPAFIDVNGIKYIVGISSHQTGQAKHGKGRYGVTEFYTRVSTYREWITKTMKQ